jgi:TonB family protein
MLRPLGAEPQWAGIEQLRSSFVVALALHGLLLGINGLWPQVAAPDFQPQTAAFAEQPTDTTAFAEDAGIVARASSGNALPGEKLAQGVAALDGEQGQGDFNGLDQSAFASLAEQTGQTQLLSRQSPLKVFYSASQQRSFGADVVTQLPQAAQTDQGDGGQDQASAIAATNRLLTLGAASREDEALRYVEGWRRWMRANGNLLYPAEARRLGLRGEVLTEVRLNSDGSLADVRILRSSGQRLLDQAVLQTTKEARWYLPFPPQLAKSYDQLQFSWRWRYGAAEPASAVQ